MKKTIYMIFVLLLIFPFCLFSQEKSDNNFNVGEEFRYTAWFNFIKSGESFMKVVAIDTIDNNPVYHFLSQTNSSRFLDRFFKVREHMESWTDVEGMFSRKYYKKVHEGRYKKKYMVDFNYDDFHAYSNFDTIPFSGELLDGLSMIYYVRTIDISIGQIIKISVYDNDKLKDFDVLVTGKKKIKVPAGKFECWVLKPSKKSKKNFKYKNSITIYLSCDQYKIPVKIINEAKFGKLILNLESHELQ